MADEVKAPGATPSPAKTPGAKWWHMILFGLLAIGLAVWLYFDLTRFETEGGTRRLNALLVLAYKIGGKWGVVGLLSVFGIGFIGVGIKQKSSEKS